MSEYQYYEFRAIDRPLSREDQSYLRSLSTRASITSTSFVNEYDRGDFNGSPIKLMHRCFDLHVYYANWGSQQLMLKLPKSSLQGIEPKRYKSDTFEFHFQDDHVVVCLRSLHDELDDDFDLYDRSWADDLLPLREMLLSGDERVLYLAWLAGIDPEDEEPGPPVPPGMDDLPDACTALIEFLGIDPDAAEEAAAVGGKAQPTTDDPQALRKWIAGLGVEEKEGMLIRVVEAEAIAVRSELRRGFREHQSAQKPKSDLKAGGISAQQLWESARRREEVRVTAEREKNRLTREAAARADAEARRSHLAELLTRFDKTWDTVRDLIKSGNTTYPQAVKLLADLREASATSDRAAEFESRLAELVAEFHRRSSLMQQLRRAKLTGTGGAA